MLGLAAGLQKSGASLLTFVKDNLKLYLDFKSNKSDTLKFPSEGSTSFDGVDDYIDCGDIDDMDGASKITIAGWAKRLESNDRITFEKSTSTTNRIGLNLDTNGVLYANVSTGSAGAYGYASLSGTDWNHIAMVYDGTQADNATRLKLYINGIKQSSNYGGHNIPATTASSAGTFKIGRAINNSNYSSTGSATNVAVWSRALTPEEVQSIMNKSYSQLKGVEKTSLVSWWGLDNDTAMQSNVSTFLDNTTGADGTWDNSGGVMTISSDRYRYFNHFIPSAVSDTSKKMKFTITAKKTGSGSVSLWFKGNTIDTFPLTNNYQTFTINMYNQTVGDNFVKFTGASESNQVIVTKFDAQYYGSYDSHGSNNGNNNYVAPVFTESLSSDGLTYGSILQLGGNAPILPRAVDVAKEGQADAIGDGSASFDGDADHIELGSITSSNALSLSGSAGSISAWIYQPDVSDGDGFQRIVDKSDAGSASKGYSLMVSHNGEIYGFMAGTQKIVSDAGEITDAQWFHIVWTWDGTNHKLYKNGILIKISSSVTTPPSDTADMAIGSWNHSTGREFKGNMSQIGFWRGALTQFQIQEVFESTSYSKIPADVKSTLGSELVVDMDTWSMNAGTATLDTSTNSVTMNQEEGSTNISFTNYFNGAGLLDSNLPNGFYKLSFNVSWDNNPTSRKIHIYEDGTNVVSTDMVLGENVRYFKITGSNVNHSLAIYSPSNNDTIVISNLSLKEVTNDLVAYYPLDGSSEVKGLSFNGSNDFIQLPTPFSHTNHSISVWVNHSGINENIFSAQDGSSDGIRLFIDDGNRLQYRINGSNALVTSASYPNQWVHYVCTYDGSTMRVYANGVQVKTNATSQTVSTTTNARIGATSFEAGGYLEGSISSVALYNVTKSADEILTIYNDNIGGDESSNSGLVGYYKMNNASTVSDLSSNSNDGTVNGATLISAGTTDSVGNNDGGLL